MMSFIILLATTQGRDLGVVAKSIPSKLSPKSQDPEQEAQGEAKSPWAFHRLGLLEISARVLQCPPLRPAGQRSG